MPHKIPPLMPHKIPLSAASIIFWNKFRISIILTQKVFLVFELQENSIMNWFQLSGTEKNYAPQNSNFSFIRTLVQFKQWRLVEYKYSISRLVSFILLREKCSKQSNSKKYDTFRKNVDILWGNFLGNFKNILENPTNVANNHMECWLSLYSIWIRNMSTTF